MTVSQSLAVLSPLAVRMQDPCGLNDDCNSRLRVKVHVLHTQKVHIEQCTLSSVCVCVCVCVCGNL